MNVLLPRTLPCFSSLPKLDVFSHVHGLDQHERKLCLQLPVQLHVHVALLDCREADQVVSTGFLVCCVGSYLEH